MNKQIALATLLTVLTLVGYYFGQNNNKSDQFNQWKLKYGHLLDSTEEPYRRFVFYKNLQIIENHNADPAQTYKMGVNQFTIYSDEQFKELFLSVLPESQIKHQSQQMIVINQQLRNNIDEPVPNADIDWQAKGKVSRVKNQGSCGACWSFSALAACQSWGLINGKTLDLSEQQLVDCSGSYGNKGCQGGWPAWALKYVQQKGVVNQIDYPYVAKQQTCQRSGGSFKITKYTTVSSSCSAIATALNTEPLAVTVDATNWSRYSSGVFSNCGSYLNHAVLLVGTINSNWKIKNSWGASWGLSGYMMIASGNTCGICQAGASYPS